MTITKEMTEVIEKIIKSGNAAELKREKDQIVIVEIKRKVKNKTPIPTLEGIK